MRLKGSTPSILLILYAILLSCAHAQTAEVTIYSHGDWTHNLHPLSRNGVFRGGVWLDGDPLLFVVGGLLGPNNHFLTFTISAGSHTFGLGDGRKPRKGSEMALAMDGGKHYYLRMLERSNILSSDVSTFEVVPCATAHDHLAEGKPLDWRLVVREKRSLISDNQEPPRCPASAPTAPACNPHS